MKKLVFLFAFIAGTLIAANAQDSKSAPAATTNTEVKKEEAKATTAIDTKGDKGEKGCKGDKGSKSCCKNKTQAAAGTEASEKSCPGEVKAKQGKACKKEGKGCCKDKHQEAVEPKKEEATQ